MTRKLSTLLIALLIALVPLAAEEAEEPIVCLIRENASDTSYEDISEDIAWGLSYWGVPADIRSIEDDLPAPTGGFSSGTGFYISPDTIVTNAHVVEDAPDDLIVCTGGKEIPATLLYMDDEEDLAVIRTARRSGPFFRVLRSGEYKPAEPVLVLGYPLSDLLGGEIRITNGIINALSGMSGDRSYMQISAPIQPGNSGGPVVNSKFEVAGIASASLDDIDQALPQNINFALKADIIRSKAGKYVPRTGDYVSDIDEAIDATVEILAGADSGDDGLPYLILYSWDETVDGDDHYVTAVLTAHDLAAPELPIIASVFLDGYTTASRDNTVLYLTSELIDRMIDWENGEY